MAHARQRPTTGALNGEDKRTTQGVGKMKTHHFDSLMLQGDLIVGQWDGLHQRHGFWLPGGIAGLPDQRLEAATHKKGRPTQGEREKRPIRQATFSGKMKGKQRHQRKAYKPAE